MNDPTQLTDVEIFWVGSLVLLMLGCMGWAARSSDPRAWLQPPLVMTVILFYYAVAAPLNMIHHGNTVDRWTDFRWSMVYSWAGACVSFLSFLMGYGLMRQRLRPPRFRFSMQAAQINKIGQRINAIGLMLFSLASGVQVLLAYLNPTGLSNVDVSYSGLNLGAFSNYAMLSINLMIPGCLLIAAAWMPGAKSPIPPPHLAIWLFVTMAIYTSIGYRWRIAVLAGSLLMLWLFSKRIRPNFAVLIPAILGLLYMAGYVGLARTYGAGLNLNIVRDLSFIDILLAGFDEAKVFLTCAGLIQLTPQYIPYVGFITPVINTLLFPIPKALFPAKDSAGYILNATDIVYGGDGLNAGAVLLNYAEYYLMGGWLGIVFWSFLLGWLCRRLWLWCLCRCHDPLVQVIYVCNAAYLYVVVSRGYMPQVVMLWCFTVLPLFLLYYHCQKRARTVLGASPGSTRALLPRHLQQLRP